MIDCVKPHQQEAAFIGYGTFSAEFLYFVAVIVCQVAGHLSSNRWMKTLSLATALLQM